jgi:hypothetical protein
MNKKISCSIILFLFGAAAALGAPQLIAFERNDAVWIANLDGTGEKKTPTEFSRPSRRTEGALHLTPSKKRAGRVTCVTWPWSKSPPEN